MSRSLSYLRRGLLGIAFMGSLGFGVTQAFANPVEARFGSCRIGMIYEPPSGGCPECPSGDGFCNGWSTECECY